MIRRMRGSVSVVSRPLSRRDFLASGLVSVGSVLIGPSLWRRALAAPRTTDGPYGPLGAPDGNGISLPDGFTSRVVARSGERLHGYVWHDAPDGGATFKAPGGWIYVSNSEVGGGGGGVGALRFDDDGTIVDAYPIASGTSRNCSGGPTPWRTWLTCEEVDTGRVWECDPVGEARQEPLPALGIFTHEAAAVDPEHEHAYLTEDAPDGRFYRFAPDRYPDLGAGTLQAAEVAPDGAVRWHEVPDPSASDGPTRRQVALSTPFRGGEGTWFDAGVVYFTTKGDDRVWAYDTRSEHMSLLHDPQTTDGTPLRGVDNLTVSAASGDLFIAEDGGNLEIVIVTPSDEIAPLLRVTGPEHSGSELAGPALDPSGERMYFSSQRGFDRGITYEITGPFRTTRLERRETSVSPSEPPSDAPSAAPLPLASDEDGSAVGVAAAAVGGAAIVGGAALTRRRLRRRADRSDA
jgi:hypothetical protein